GSDVRPQWPEARPMMLGPGLRIAVRVLAATGGAWAATMGSVALVAVLLLLAAPLTRSDALIVGSMIGYPLFAFLMLWCFAERWLSRVWLVLLLATLATHSIAILVEPALPVMDGAS
ncbi:MAG: hypothetical protein QM690_16845, partial [Sphingobium sp.]